MITNESSLIDLYLDAAQAERDVPLPEAVAFELFAASAVMKDKNLSSEEILFGRIGGGRDGAIDAVYVLQDGRLLDEDSHVFRDDFKIADARKGVELDLHIVQAKQESSFTETALDLIASSTRRLLDLSASHTDLTNYYSDEVIGRFELFRQAWKLLSVRSPAIRIHVEYVSKGDSAAIGKPVQSKAIDLESSLRALVPGARVSVGFIGARDLWSIVSTPATADLELRFVDYNTQGVSYVGLASLRDYSLFLSGTNGELREALFDWNVRDYQGSVAVNTQIQSTLVAGGPEDFWWLNNGVTILCSSASIGGDKTFTLTDPQIVNGMQTSHSIHHFVSNSDSSRVENSIRSVLVRLIVTRDEALRDRIIRATNSQTRVPDASLHATEDIHRQIEAHFLSEGWFYDRRKNHYRNLGKPTDRIVGIPALGQATMAIGLGRPDDARARPSTLLNNPTDYPLVFSEKTPLHVYHWLASTQRRVDLLLLRDADSYMRSNFRFHVSAYLVTKKFGQRIYNPSQLKDFASERLEVDDGDTFLAINQIQDLIQNSDELEFGEWSIDRFAKSRVFAEMVLDLGVSHSTTGPPTS